MHLLVDYKSGFRLSYSEVYFSTHYGIDVWLWGTEGSLHILHNRSENRVTFTPIVGAMKKGNEVDIPIPGGTAGGHGGGDQPMVDAIVAATIDSPDTHLRPNALDGRRGVAIAEYGRRSIETGLPQDIPAPTRA